MKINNKKEIKFGCPYTAKRLKTEVIQTADKIFINDPTSIINPCPDDHRLSIYPNSTASISDIKQMKIDAIFKHFDKKTREFKNLPNSKASFIKVHKDYMAWFKKRIGTKGFSDKTYETYEHVARGHIYSTSIGASDIGSIDSIDLENLYDEIQEKFILESLGPDLFLLVSVVVKAVFKYAVTKRFINDNPYTQLVSEKANKIRLDLKEENTSNVKSVDVNLVINFVDFVGEISRFDKQYIDLANYMLITLHLATRSAETSGIYLDDVDFINKKIHIQRQTFKQYSSKYIDSENKIVTKKLKTKAGDRFIPLSSHLIKLFEKIDIDYREGVLIPDAQGNRPLWQFPTGVPTVFAGKLTTFLRNYGAEFKTRFGKAYEHVFHALRHAGISTWIRGGIDLYRVMKMAGHSNISTTVNIYGHEAKEHDYFNMSDLIKGVKNVTSDLLSNNSYRKSS